MASERLLAAIDIGTAKVATLVARATADGELELLGSGVVPSEGISKGRVIDLDLAADAVRASVQQAEASSGARIKSAIVTVSGSHLESLNHRGIVSVAGRDQRVSRRDVEQAAQAGVGVRIPEDSQIIHAIPRTYVLDGQEGVSQPEGMHGYRLDAEYHIVTAGSAPLQNLSRSLGLAGVRPAGLAAQGLAAAEAVLTPEERELGVMLADVGEGTTDVVVVTEGGPWHTAVLPVGGHQLSNDLATALKTPLTTAEVLKTAYGHTMEEEVPSDETVDFVAFGEGATQRVRRRELARLLGERSREIVTLIGLELERCGKVGRLAAGLVLTGGTAELPGFAEQARRVLGLPVRVGRPLDAQRLREPLTRPAFAAAVGLLHHALAHPAPVPRASRATARVASVSRGLASWFRQLAP